MNTSSLELSKRLFELSGWETGEYTEDSDLVMRTAYDAGYLLRKLPRTVEVNDATARTARLEIVFKKESITVSYESYYYEPWQTYYEQYADTPEDCLAKLAIKLLEEGIIDGDKRDDNGLKSSKGSKNGNSKLSEEDVKQIRYEHQLGRSTTKLAKDWGVHVTTIRRAISGKRYWKNV